MEKTWLRSIIPGGTTEGDTFSASTLFVSGFVLIFAAITQVLAWIGAITLSTTQQVAIWLVVVGFIVLLSIAGMACRAYVTAKMYEALTARPQGAPTPQAAAGPPGAPTSQTAAGPQVEPTSQTAAGPPDGSTSQTAAGPPDGSASQTSQPGASSPIPPDGPHAPWTVPTGNGNPGNGSRLAVRMADVFPHGCYLVQDSISEAQDCDESVDTRVVVDRLTGKRVFSCRVTDMHPELKGQPRNTVVKVVADGVPVLPSPADGSPFTAIAFEGLTAAGPPTIDRGRAAYSSLRATGIRLAPTVTPAPQ